MGSRPTTIVVSDANVLINLIYIELLALLSQLPDLRFVVPDEVDREVTRTEHRKALDAAFAAGWLERARLEAIDALRDFESLRKQMGSGEAACLALATQHSWAIATDEKRVVRREANKRLGEGRVLTTPTILHLAIEARLLSIADADRAKTTLEKNRFKMNFESFAELVRKAEKES